ncbi:hypothetical protein [Nocardioides jejuensis]|uniref:Uncharacterized protein n=1 Tax=Nocardioides jejuensis TaxID=2502782 RepID=A0A4R1CJQ4_9ACTN|nr:hypothetical protein [Nocardioides jejuensis]TCJ30416.1 hypothetical protein EPD65_04240 [Nocardioides jejuensis]
MFLIRCAGLATGAVAALALAAGPAAAHDCIQTQKDPSGGGVAGTYYIATDTFVPNGQAHGGFIAVVFPDGTTIVSFNHPPAMNDYVVPGAKGCDGKGLDSGEACFGE